MSDQKIFEDPFEGIIATLNIKQKIATTHQESVTVWLVEMDNKLYALKSINRTVLNNQAVIDQLYQEKQALAELDHPSIIKMVRTLKDDKEIHILMHLAYGVSLEKLIQLHKKLNPQFVKLIAIQIILALNYMHQEGFIYRDVKASNIVIDQQGKVKLIDLGLSKKIFKQRTNSYCGTLHSMSPEFFDEKIDYSFEVDTYAVGILIFELVVGVPPFGYFVNDIDKEQMIKRIQKGLQKSDLSLIQDEILIDLIDSLCKVNKNQRISLDDAIVHKFFQDVDIQLINKFVRNQIDEIYEQDIVEQFYVDQYQSDIELMGITKINQDEQITEEQQKQLDDIFN